MEITLLYFAAVRDLLGKSEEKVALPPEVSTVADLQQWLERERPALRERMAFVRLARNEEFAMPADRLASGGVVALIPPVAGG